MEGGVAGGVHEILNPNMQHARANVVTKKEDLEGRPCLSSMGRMSWGGGGCLRGPLGMHEGHTRISNLACSMPGLM